MWSLRSISGRDRSGTATSSSAERLPGRLGRLKDGDLLAVLPALVTALGDEDERVAVTVARPLATALQAAPRSGDAIAARRAVTALVAALKDPRPGVRKAAAGGLVAAALGFDFLGADAAAACTHALVAALSDQSDEVRWAAASALGAFGKGIPPPGALVAALNGDPSTRVRAAAALSLGQFRSGHDQTTVALLHALGTDEPEVRKACDSALVRLKALRDAKEERRSAAIVPALIEALTSHEVLVRYHAAAILGEVGAEARASVPALIGILSESLDSKIKHTDRRDPQEWDPVGEAALALGEIAPETPQAGEVVTALIAVIRSATRDRRPATVPEGLARDWRRARAAGRSRDLTPISPLPPCRSYWMC